MNTLLNLINKYYKFDKNNLKLLPLLPGIYIYLNKDKKIIYIGKAKSLRSRVKSYFNKNLYGKTDRLVKSIYYFSFIRVESEAESILLEARLIGKYKPIYNIELKDDKGPLYAYLTNERLPRLLLARKNKIENNAKYIWGPFINSRNLKWLLRSLRHIIPYAIHKPAKKMCLYSQMGLCSPCPSQIELDLNTEDKKVLIKKYKRNISNLKLFFSGKFTRLNNSLEKQMQFLSSEQKYEEAQDVKNRILILKEITSSQTAPETYMEDPYYSEKITRKRLHEFRLLLNHYFNVDSLEKIECYDIAHIQGSNAAGSMVTFVKGKPQKSLYRHFRLRVSRNSDVGSLNEIINRRINHLSEWGTPNLVIVDGGKGQVNVFVKTLSKYHIPVVGIAKRFERLIIPSEGGFEQIALKGGPLFIVQYMRNEAHRFAQRYHHKLVEKNLLNIVE